MQAALDRVRFVATSALPTYTASGSGLARILTVTATGAMAAIDGVTPGAGDLLLAVGNATAADNGIWVVTNPGSTGVQPVLTRSPGYQTGLVTSGMQVQAGSEGTNGGNSVWTCVTTGAITVDTTATTWQMLTGNWVEGISTAVGTMANPSGYFFAAATLKARFSGFFEVHLDLGYSSNTNGDSATFNLITDTVADGAGAVLASANKVAHGISGFGAYGARGSDWESVDTNGGAVLTFNSAAFNAAQIVQASEVAPAVTGLLANASQKFSVHAVVGNAALTGTTKTPFTIGNQVAFGVSVSATNTITVKSVRLFVREVPNL